MSGYQGSNGRSQAGLAKGLAWFGITLGLAELILPDGLAGLMGVRKRRGMFRLLGLKELASGVGILSRPRSAPWLWSRVAGDVMDLALLGTALASPSTNRKRAAAATAAVVGVTALDVFASQKQSRNRNGNGAMAVGGPVQVRKSIIIERAAQELYHYWRDFENLPRFMYHLDSVRVLSPTRSRWVAKAPAGSQVEWEAEITQDKTNELIAWRSVEGSDVQHSGRVRFTRAPGNRGTLVEVEMEYTPPAGKIGEKVAKLFRKEPGQEISDSLRFFKQLMEAGTILTTEGQPAGRAKSTSRKFDYKVPKVPAVEVVNS